MACGSLLYVAEPWLGHRRCEPCSSIEVADEEVEFSSAFAIGLFRKELVPTFQKSICTILSPHAVCSPWQVYANVPLEEDF